MNFGKPIFPERDSERRRLVSNACVFSGRALEAKLHMDVA